MKLPHIKTPCTDCPFRIDSTKGWLGKIRIQEILNQDSFVCHKDTNLQCAGHMLIKKLENIFVYTAKALNIDLNLSGNEHVFNTELDCINHHTH